MEVVDGMVRGIMFPAMFLTKIWTVSSESDVVEESEVILFERDEGRIVAIGWEEWMW